MGNITEDSLIIVFKSQNWYKPSFRCVKSEKKTWIIKISKIKMAAGGHIGFKTLKGLSLVPIVYLPFYLRNKHFLQENMS